MSTPPIKVSGPAEILGTIPVLLGFHPEDSLVVVGLSGPQLRVGPVARADLPIGPDGIRALGDTLARHVTHAIVVIYGGQPARSSTGTALSDGALRCHLGLQIVDVLRAPNTPRQVHAPIAEASALSGRAVLRDRAAVRASVEHHPGTGTTHNRCTVAAVTTTREARDRYLTKRISDAASVLPELIAAAQSTPDTHPGTADLCAVLAFLAYRTGDGALAQVAIDRALRVHPGHRLARLALDAIACGMPPEQLDQVITA